ncbi:sulfatase-like hydrolase/transferase [Myxococcota bacterium]|nr:sulfatase-like hydrolase/transferase [Myxococcota bacterium]
MITLATLLALGCGTADRTSQFDEAAAPTEESPPNLLVIVLDDFGVEASACYPDMGVPRAPQPNMEALCNRGVVFDQAWAHPLCSPTRAALLTGRSAWRTGVGQAIADEQIALAEDEPTLPRLLTDSGLDYATSLVGKWHLGIDTAGPGLAGFQHFTGTMPGHIDDYYHYSKYSNGEWVDVDNYATTEQVDDAVAWIRSRSQPWMMMLNFNSPHTPLHEPPSDLHSLDFDAVGADEDLDSLHYVAMVEAIDAELGRLLASLGDERLENTTIVLMGDNGSDATTTWDLLSPDHAKGTLYNGGVHVPLVVIGAGVREGGRRVPDMVGTIDLHATLLELVGVDYESLTDLETDSQSLVPYLEDPQAAPARDHLLVELYGSRVQDHKQGRAVRDERFKLVRIETTGDELYDLLADPWESDDLLVADRLSPEAETAYQALSETLDALPPVPEDEVEEQPW